MTEPESVTLDSDEGNQEDNNPEENPVMNFFKSLVSDTISELSVVCMHFVFLIACKIRFREVN